MGKFDTLPLSSHQIVYDGPNLTKVAITGSLKQALSNGNHIDRESQGDVKICKPEMTPWTLANSQGKRDLLVADDPKRQNLPGLGEASVTGRLSGQCTLLTRSHPALTELSGTQGTQHASGAISILSQLLVKSVPLNTVKLPTR